jgi:hypothetical protein
MKYAIANQDGIVYTIRDTADGFKPENTRGELCVPITDAQAAVVRPHYEVFPDGSFAPRAATSDVKARAIADLDGRLESERERANQVAEKALLQALLAQNPVAQQAARDQLAINLAAIDATRPALAATIAMATTYHELPGAVRYDNGGDNRPAVSVAANAMADNAVRNTANGVATRPIKTGP